MASNEPQQMCVCRIWKPFDDLVVTTAPRIDIDLVAFWDDPYPVRAELRRDAPIAFCKKFALPF